MVLSAAVVVTTGAATVVLTILAAVLTPVFSAALATVFTTRGSLGSRATAAADNNVLVTKKESTAAGWPPL
jgi:hypothetical protein